MLSTAEIGIERGEVLESEGNALGQNQHHPEGTDLGTGSGGLLASGAVLARAPQLEPRDPARGRAGWGASSGHGSEPVGSSPPGGKRWTAVKEK